MTRDFCSLLCEEQNQFRENNSSHVISNIDKNTQTINHMFYDGLLTQVFGQYSLLMLSSLLYGFIDLPQPTIIDFGKCCYYYTPSPSLCLLSGTCARKGFITGFSQCNII